MLIGGGGDVLTGGLLVGDGNPAQARVCSVCDKQWSGRPVLTVTSLDPTVAASILIWFAGHGSARKPKLAHHRVPADRPLAAPWWIMLFI